MTIVHIVLVKVCVLCENTRTSDLLTLCFVELYFVSSPDQVRPVQQRGQVFPRQYIQAWSGEGDQTIGQGDGVGTTCLR